MNNQNTESRYTTIILSAVLGLSLLLGGFFGYKAYNLSTTNDLLSSEIGQLETAKEDLIADMEQLQSEYEVLMSEHSDLQTTFADANAEIELHNQNLASIKSRSSNSSGLADEVIRLRGMRAEYAFILNELRQQAIILTDANVNLQDQNAELQKRLKKMKNQSELLAKQVFDMKYTRSMAALNPIAQKEAKPLFASQEVLIEKGEKKEGAMVNNFTFNVTKKGDKPTGSHKRAKKIGIRFDVYNAKNEIDQNQEIFLVIKDANGMPVEVENPIKTTIHADGYQKEEIIAQQVMTANLKKNNTLKFEILPKRKTLNEGFYRASIYSKKGLLGYDEFYLR